MEKVKGWQGGEWKRLDGNVVVFAKTRYQACVGALHRGYNKSVITNVFALEDLYVVTSCMLI